MVPLLHLPHPVTNIADGPNKQPVLFLPRAGYTTGLEGKGGGERNMLILDTQTFALDSNDPYIDYVHNR